MKKKIKVLINYIKYFCRVGLRLINNIFNVFRIKNNRIIFSSYNGKQYSCNPRAIYEYLQANSEKNIGYIWVFNNPEKYKNMLPNKTKCIRSNSIKHIFYQKTSKIIITNARGKGTIGVRKNQIMIQTWHASNGYKQLSNLKGIKLKESNLFCKDITVAHCGCANMKKERLEKTFGFFGEIIKGTPRMDKIISSDNNHELKKNIIRKYNIDDPIKVVLYAPTYRNKTKNDFGLDYENLINSLNSRFGGKWIVFVRSHYFVKNMIKESANSSIVDVSDYPDMLDLLLISDVLISDYSSCIWDFSFLNKPTFLFCPDLDEYRNNTKFNVPIEEWGFSVSKTNKELGDNILSFDDSSFRKKIDEHHKKMGSFEDGFATKRTFDYIMSVVK